MCRQVTGFVAICCKKFLMYHCGFSSIFRRWVRLVSIINPAGAKRFKKTLASCLTFQEKQVAVDPISRHFSDSEVEWGVTCVGPCVSLS